MCRDERSMHKGPVRFANMKIKHNDNKKIEKNKTYINITTGVVSVSFVKYVI